MNRDEVRELYDKWAKLQHPEPPESVWEALATTIFDSGETFPDTEIVGMFQYSYWDGKDHKIKEMSLHGSL